MRVAANLVESILFSAQRETALVERDTPHDQQHSADFSGLVAAFRRADDLRRVPFGTKRVRGAKSRRWQNVITTTQHKTEAGHDYTLCLIANPGGRRPFCYTVERRDENGKVYVDHFTTSAIPAFVEQWIRDDRLEAA